MAYFRLHHPSDNPLCDPFIRLSRSRADEALRSGSVYRDDADPPNVLRRRPTRQERDARQLIGGGTMREAWQVRDSAGFLVWQMRHTLNLESA